MGMVSFRVDGSSVAPAGPIPGRRRPRRASGPTGSLLTVAGMHRSGTSLVASFLEALGVDMGRELVSLDAENPRGYFEDVGFLDLDRRLLHCSTAVTDGGHRDWGWTESEQLDRSRFGELLPAAQALIEKRSGEMEGPWGFKDPRATLLLDFWNEVAADAKFVLLYRYPWDVADSMQRLGADVFLERPEYAYRIWSFYNRHLLSFYRRHSDRAVLASTNALVRQPDRFVDLLKGKLGLELGAALWDELYEKDLFRTVDGSDPLIGLVNATSPEVVRRLRELDDAADLSSAGLWADPGCRCARVRPAGAGGPVDLSVVIPCLDHGQFLIEAVASVERSAPSGSELIIVNDGSRQPRTLEVLAVLRQAGYHVIDQEQSGLPVARNRGIEAARGRYVLPLDADNRLRPGFPAAALRVLDASPEVGVVYGDCQEFGRRSGRREVGDASLARLLWGNYIDACAVFRKDLWSDVGRVRSRPAVVGRLGILDPRRSPRLALSPPA